MMKSIKYAVMALLLIGGLKVIQVLFINQEYKKNNTLFGTKEEKKDEAAEVAAITPAQKKETSVVLDTAKTEDEPFESTEKTSTSKRESYPTLNDLKKNYLSIQNASLQDGRSREDVVIRYYKHEKDGNKVYALRKLRYYLHEKPATETEGLGSNVMYYGDQVKLEDIQVVAYTLLEKGIPLKSIEKSKFDWKSNAIEIGTDSLLIGTENMTESDVRNFSF